MKSRWLLVSLVWMVLGAPEPALARKVFEIRHADTWIYESGNGTQRLEGKVQVQYEGMELRAENLTLVPSKSRKKLTKARAEGGVQLSQEGRVGRGESASYDFGTGAVEISGNAEVSEGSNVIHADTIRFDQGTTAMTATGKVTGSFQGGSAGSQKKAQLSQADRWSFDPAQHLHDLSGGVVLVLEDAKISASRILLRMDETNQTLLSAETFPPLAIVKADLRATADSAVYYPGGGTDESFVLKGRARMEKGTSALNGDEIVFYPRTGQVSGKGIRMSSKTKAGENLEVKHADRWEFDPDSEKQVLSGAVNVEYQGMQLRADQVALSPVPGEEEAVRAEATGNVRMTQGDQVAQGQSASYDPQAGVVQISGDARVIQGQNTVRADQIRFSRSTSAMSAVGNVSGQFAGSGQEAESVTLQKAEQWIFDPAKHSHELKGDVVLTLKDTKLSSSRILLYMDETNRAFLKAESSPPLEIAKGDIWATGDSAEYYPASGDSDERIVLTGHAKLKQGENFMTGEQITFFPKTGTMTGQGVHVTVKVEGEEEPLP